jgi:diguanylate cyclase (GGDEF)-like protein
MIIDDSKFMLAALSSILNPFYHVHGFQDVMRAIHNIEDVNPSLILLDVVMPDMSGFEAIKLIKADPAVRDVPVIMMTAQDEKSDSDNEVQCFMLGAVDFVLKPFKAAVVLARVRTHVKLHEYHRELEKTSVTDALTGIYNRRGFNEMMHHEWSRSVRESSDLSLCMIDIDHFKFYNDHYGHQEGDNALHMVGQAIKNALHRETDIAARYGGEEFAVILPEVDGHGAATVAENLNQVIRDLNIKHEHSPVAPVVTISIGVATSCELPHEDHLIKAADDMLYQAKESGRNRFCRTVL